jgi:hypothetical protein
MPESDKTRDPLTDDETRVFFGLLRRICENDVDNFSLFRIDTDAGPFYVQLGMAPEGDPDLYWSIGPEWLPPRES